MKPTNLLLISTILVLFSTLAYSADEFIVTDPTQCPSENQSQFPGQNCAPENICGESFDIALCFNTSTLTAPTFNTTTQSNPTSAIDGGYYIDCFQSADASEPFCYDSSSPLCDRNSSHYNSPVFRRTICLENTFGSTAVGICRSGRFNCYAPNANCESTATSACSQGGDNNHYNTATCDDATGGGTCICDAGAWECDGVIDDANGCEFDTGESCGFGTGTYPFDQCLNTTHSNCTSAVNLDCDNDDNDFIISTCNGDLNGCEITIGDPCTIEGLPGSYGDTCSGGAGVCILDDVDIATSGHRVNWSTVLNPLLWMKDFGIGQILRLETASNNTYHINDTGPYWNNASTLLDYNWDRVNDDIINTNEGSVNVSKNFNVEGAAKVGNFTAVTLGNGSLGVENRILSQGGVATQASQFGLGLNVFSSDDTFSIVSLGETAELNVETQIFCDSIDPFADDNLRDIISVASSDPIDIIGAQGQIRQILNATCVAVSFCSAGSLAVQNLENITYFASPAPDFFVFDQGCAGATIGEHPDALYEIFTPNATGPRTFVSLAQAGTRATSAGEFTIDAKGNKDVTSLVSIYTTTEETNNSRNSNLILSTNLLNHNEGEFNVLEQTFIGLGTNMTTNAFNLAPTTNIMVVDRENIPSASYYWNGSVWIDVFETILLEGGITGWEEPGTIGCLGNDINYTKTAFALNPGASENIEPVLLYPKNGVWTEFNATSDGTNGFQNDGIIRWDPLTNRSSVNYGPNGVPFPVDTNYTYLCSNRTNNNTLTQLPFVQIVSIFEEQIKLRVGEEGITGEEGAIIWENLEQRTEGGGLWQLDFFNTEGILESAAGFQTGAENFSSYIRNSLCVLSTRNLTDDQKSDKALLYNCRERVNQMDLLDDLNFFSSNIGADLQVEHHMKAQGIFTDDSLGNGVNLLRGVLLNQLRDLTYGTFFGGLGINIVNQGQETIGLSIGELVDVLFEKWDAGNLGVFISTTPTPYEWDFTTGIDCPTVIGSIGCVEATTCLEDNECEMNTTFSTSNFDKCNLSFYINAPDLTNPSAVFVINFTNNTGAPDENVYTLNTDLIDTFVEVDIPAGMDNQSSVTAKVNFVSPHPVRGAAWLDEFRVQCSSLISTQTNRTTNNGEIIFGSTSENPCGITLYDNQSNKNLDISCTNVTINGLNVGLGGSSGGGVSGSGTTNTVAKWVSTSAIGDSSITDDGSSISLGVDTTVTGNVSADWTNSNINAPSIVTNTDSQCAAGSFMTGFVGDNLSEQQCQTFDLNESDPIQPWTNDSNYIYIKPGHPGNVNITDKLTVFGITRFNKSIGINQDPDPVAGFSITDNGTQMGVGLLLEGDIVNEIATTGDRDEHLYSGINLATTHNPDNPSGQLNMFNLQAILEGSNSITIWRGNFVSPISTAYTGVIDSMKAFEAKPVWVSGNITNLYGFHYAPVVSATDLDNSWGIKIDNMPVGDDTTYAIETGTGPSKFGDNVTVDGSLNVTSGTTSFTVTPSGVQIII